MKNDCFFSGGSFSGFHGSTNVYIANTLFKYISKKIFPKSSAMAGDEFLLRTSQIAAKQSKHF